MRYRKQAQNEDERYQKQAQNEDERKLAALRILYKLHIAQNAQKKKVAN